MTQNLSFVYKIAVLFFLFLIIPLTSFAGEDDRFKGWAWSSTVGWISFNCTNTDTCGTVDYGVTIAANNTDISGYAWSSQIGWINFAGTNFNSGTGIISGTALAIVGEVEVDGWDGKIELYDASPIAYGLDVQLDNEVDGYAWGDRVIGWVSFNCQNHGGCGTVDYKVTVEPFYFSFGANIGTTVLDKVSHNGSTTLNWTTIDAVSCTASGAPATGWASPPGKSAGEPTPGTETIANLTADTTFTLTCQDSIGRTITRDLLIYVHPPAPSLTMTADDYNIALNGSTNINWDALYIASCDKTGQWGTGSASAGAGQSQSTGSLSNLENFFNLTCYSDNPVVYPNPVFAQVLVNVEKLTLEFALDADNVPFADPTVLNWTSTFATSCTASGGAGTTWTSPAAKGIITDNAYAETVYKAGTTEPLDTGSYTFTLTCNGASGQQVINQATLKVGRNPQFSEEIGNDPNN